MKIQTRRNELTWIIIGQVLAFVGGFFAIKILTNVMGAEGYGQLALGVTIAGLCNLFVYGPLGQTVSRYYSVCRERGNLETYFYTLKKTHLVSVVALSICVLFVVIFAWLIGLENKWAQLIVAAVFFGIVSGISSSFQYLQSAVRQRKIVAIHQAAEAWLRPGLGILALIWLSNSASVAFLGFFIGTLVITLSQFFFAMRTTQIRSYWSGDISSDDVRKKTQQEFSIYYRTLSGLAIFSVFSVYADRWILQGMLDQNSVGIYVAIFQIASAPIVFLFNFTTRYVEPIIFERVGASGSDARVKSSDRFLYKVIAIFFVLLVPIIGISFLFGEPLVLMLTSAEFGYHSDMLWVFTLGLTMYYVAQLLTIKGASLNRPNIYVLPKLLQAIMLLVAGIIFTPQFGVMGMAEAVLLTSGVYLALVIIANQKLPVQCI